MLDVKGISFEYGFVDLIIHEDFYKRNGLYKVHSRTLCIGAITYIHDKRIIRVKDELLEMLSSKGWKELWEEFKDDRISFCVIDKFNNQRKFCLYLDNLGWKVV